MKAKNIILLLLFLLITLIGLSSLIYNMSNNDTIIDENKSNNAINIDENKGIIDGIDENNSINTNKTNEKKSNNTTTNWKKSNNTGINVNKSNNTAKTNENKNINTTKNNGNKVTNTTKIDGNKSTNTTKIDGNKSTNTTKINENKIIISKLDGLETIKLGSNNIGSVEFIGPIGNKSSDIKIAYIIGVHPLESNAHNALYNSLIDKQYSLKYCYYIYKVNVTKNATNYDIGRMNGQLLAREFVVPNVNSKGYNLVLDIHSNQGTNGGSYEKTNFMFAPLNDSISKAFGDKIIAKIPNFVYYYPKAQSSPNYVTIPIMKSGTPTLIYETYRYESNKTTLDYIDKLINAVDNLKF